MGEKMENPERKSRIEPGIIGPSEEEIKSLTGEGAKEGLIPWIPKRLKIAMGVVVGLGATGTVGAAIWEATHPSAITEPASATQIPPEIGVPQTPPEKFEVDKEVPGEESDLWGKGEPKEEIKEPIIYTVKEGDTLTKISQEHNNLPVEIIYNMNREVVGDNPDLIKPRMEFLIIYWDPVRASEDFVYRHYREVIRKGGEIDWVYFNLEKETSLEEIANYVGVEIQALSKLNEISDPTKPLPKGYYLMIPAEEGFAFTEQDRQANRRWIPKPGISLNYIWWENPTGEAIAGPWYPNIAYMIEEGKKEIWTDGVWSTAHPSFINAPEDFKVEEITDIPYDVELKDAEGNIIEIRKGFKVYGKHREYISVSRKVEAGEWIGGLETTA